MADYVFGREVTVKLPEPQFYQLDSPLWVSGNPEKKNTPTVEASGGHILIRHDQYATYQTIQSARLYAKAILAAADYAEAGEDE